MGDYAISHRIWQEYRTLYQQQIKGGLYTLKSKKIPIESTPKGDKETSYSCEFQRKIFLCA